MTTETDDLLIAADVYRRAWMKAEQRADYYYEQCQRLKGETGRGETLYRQDMAKIAGVSVPTVIQWERRFAKSTDTIPAFPKKRAGSNPNEYDRSEFMEWLRATGRKQD